MQTNNKAKGLIGLARKAGKLADGEFSVEKAVKSGRAALVIIADDASANTRKKFTNMCAYYHVPLDFWGSKEELGAAMGKEYRASAAFLDEGFAASWKKLDNNKFSDGGMKNG